MEKQICIQYVIYKNANRLFHGIPVYSYEEKSDDLKNQYVIIATAKTHYDEIALNLIAIGGVEFDDFIWIGDIVKKLIILYGNCHMPVIEQYLNANPNVTKSYTTRRYFVSDENKKKELLKNGSCRDVVF